MHKCWREVQHCNLFRIYSKVNHRGHRGITDGDVVKIVVPHFLFVFDLTPHVVFICIKVFTPCKFYLPSNHYSSKREKWYSFAIHEILINIKLQLFKEHFKDITLNLYSSLRKKWYVSCVLQVIWYMKYIEFVIHMWVCMSTCVWQFVPIQEWQI